MSKIDVAIYKTGAPLFEAQPIDNGLEAMQAIVGGYIEAINLPEGLVLVCNEEGALRDLPCRFMAARAVGQQAAWTAIAGDFIVCRTKGADFASLKAADYPLLLDLVRAV